MSDQTHQIVLLEGHVLNPGDLSWEPLEQCGSLKVYDRSAPAEIIDRCQNADIILTNKCVLDRKIITSLPKLRFIGVCATGYNNVDVAAAAERGITVANVPSYGTDSVAQATFALLLELTNRSGRFADEVRTGAWSRSKDFSYWNSPITALTGLKLGLVGYGNIAKAVARIGEAFGMDVIVHSRTRPEGIGAQAYRSLDDLLREADVVSLHCPLTKETERLMNAERLALMKKSAFLLNTSRGGLIDEPALAAALRADALQGAGIDVLSEEPPPASNPLLTAPNIVITPHTAWAAVATRKKLVQLLAANVKAFLHGNPINVVRP